MSSWFQSWLILRFKPSHRLADLPALFLALNLCPKCTYYGQCIQEGIMCTICVTNTSFFRLYKLTHGHNTSIFNFCTYHFHFLFHNLIDYHHNQNPTCQQKNKKTKKQIGPVLTILSVDYRINCLVFFRKCTSFNFKCCLQHPLVCSTYTGIPMGAM